MENNTGSKFLKNLKTDRFSISRYQPLGWFLGGWGWGKELGCLGGGDGEGVGW